MRRIVVDESLSGKERIVFDRETSRYLASVLRLGKGDRFPVLDREGLTCDCVVLDASPKALEAKLAPAPGSSEPSAPGAGTAGLPRIALVQALPKGQKMDLILRQAVEIGVADFFPVQTRNCVALEKDGEDRASKLRRRGKIVKEALQQSGSAIQTKVHPTVGVGELPKVLKESGYAPEEALYLLFHELPLAQAGLHEYCAQARGAAVVFVGPEGGFDPGETEGLLAAGFKPVHIRGTILRTETAAVFALAAVKTLLLERTTWSLST